MKVKNFTGDYGDETEDLDPDETYESRVLSKLSNPMYEWQKNALEEWEINDYTGIIEAVTGSGKTFLGIYGSGTNCSGPPTCCPKFC
jgi:superfamily II DNA or RNA helicase